MSTFRSVAINVVSSIALWVAADGVSASERFVLITPEEAQASAKGPGLFVARSLPNPASPVIEVLSPDLKSPIAAPVPIRLRFNGATPGEPKPESFKALYGSFRIDITDRLRKRATITKAGLELSGADIPSGRHQIVMSIEDTAGRKVEQVVTFEVE